MSKKALNIECFHTVNTFFSFCYPVMSWDLHNFKINANISKKIERRKEIATTNTEGKLYFPNNSSDFLSPKSLKAKVNWNRCDFPRKFARLTRGGRDCVTTTTSGGEGFQKCHVTFFWQKNDFFHSF
jgi:hypothetical protein